MTSILKYMFAICISISMTKCDYVTNSVDGKGEVIQQEYELDDFTSLKLKNGWEVELIPSEESKMLISANENLFEELNFEESDNQLTIEASRNIGRADKKLIQLFYNQPLEEMKVSSGVYLHSASTLNATNLDAKFSSGCKTDLNLNTQMLQVDVSSGANITLTGNSDMSNFEVSSGAGVDAKELISKEAEAKTSSGASLKLHINGRLIAKSSSGGVIRYQGDVTNIEKTTSSGGSVKEM